MLIALVPSGVEWLDAEIGGLPAAGIVAALGTAGSGKTSLALRFATAQLERHARVCYVTSETPESVIETCRGIFEVDLRPHLAEGTLTLLSFAPFFVNKVRSLNSVDPPLSELKSLFEERQIEHVVLDTVDPMLAWIESASAKAGVRRMLGQMQEWRRAVFCTMSGAAPAVAELARTASCSLELQAGKLIVRQAAWCNVYGVEASIQFVQGRGLVAREGSRHPAEAESIGRTAISVPIPNSAGGMRPVGALPWTSLIADARPTEPRPQIGAKPTVASRPPGVFPPSNLGSISEVLSSDEPTPREGQRQRPFAMHAGVEEDTDREMSIEARTMLLGGARHSSEATVAIAPPVFSDSASTMERARDVWASPYVSEEPTHRNEQPSENAEPTRPGPGRGRGQ